MALWLKQKFCFILAIINFSQKPSSAKLFKNLSQGARDVSNGEEGRGGEEG